MTHKESLEQSQNYSHNINCKFSLLLGEAITSNNIAITSQNINSMMIHLKFSYISVLTDLLWTDNETKSVKPV